LGGVIVANKKLFGSATRGKTPAPATAVNEAGGRAFAFSAKHTLAQYAATGTFNDAYYSTGKDQLEAVLELCSKIDAEFVAKTALYSRESGTMKDMPALLTSYLITRDDQATKSLAKRIFPRVINNGKMLRNFVQILRSGKLGKKSLASAPTKLINSWFNSRTDDQIFWQSVGNDPSLGDIIKLAHPKPGNATRKSLYAYLMGKNKVTMRGPDGKVVEGEDLLLPDIVLEYEKFKKTKMVDASARLSLPKAPWEMLEGLNLSEEDWRNLAKQASWTQIRMNLNTFSRHGVFKDKELVKYVANKLKDEESIAKVKPFPYQLFVAYLNTVQGGGIPTEITNALQQAVEVAAKNIPIFDGVAFVCPDTSGSMSHPVTGLRAGATTRVRCIDVAALVSSVFLKKNPNSEILPFDTSVHNVSLNPMDAVMTNATKLASYGGGGTDCSAPLRFLNSQKAKGDLVLFVSDQESWVDSTRYGFFHRDTTGMLAEWEIFKARNPKAKLVCIDIQANGTGQAPDEKNILNIGGFSDAVFEQVTKFMHGTLSPDHWVGVIEAVSIDVV
jgi:60 kDa SS-A/Ro ribonucleoprotein